MSETKKYPRVEDGRLYLSCVCDGTLVFAEELKIRLRVFGCTDIQVYKETVKDADPPWMNCRFVAHGKMPDERPEEAYKDGRLRKYLRDQVYRFCTHCGPTREQMERMRGEWISDLTGQKVDAEINEDGLLDDNDGVHCSICGGWLTARMSIAAQHAFVPTVARRWRTDHEA